MCLQYTVNVYFDIIFRIRETTERGGDFSADVCPSRYKTRDQLFPKNNNYLEKC